MKNILAVLIALPFALNAQSKTVIPAPEPPIPPPGIRVVDLRSSEKPVAVEKSEAVVSENTYFKRVKAMFTFLNPNQRTMAGEFEFPIPAGAFVCGYSLEVNGEMVPGQCAVPTAPSDRPRRPRW